MRRSSTLSGITPPAAGSATWASGSTICFVRPRRRTVSPARTSTAGRAARRRRPTMRRRGWSSLPLLDFNDRRRLRLRRGGYGNVLRQLDGIIDVCHDRVRTCRACIEVRHPEAPAEDFAGSNDVMQIRLQIIVGDNVRRGPLRVDSKLETQLANRLAALVLDPCKDRPALRDAIDGSRTESNADL